MGTSVLCGNVLREQSKRLVFVVPLHIGGEASDWHSWLSYILAAKQETGVGVSNISMANQEINTSVSNTCRWRSKRVVLEL